jgi:hypothetical protein
MPPYSGYPTRYPVPGSDTNTWGFVLLNFLNVSHTSTGALSSSAVATASRTISIQSGAYSPSSSISEIVLANATSGNITITLPSASSNNNLYTVKKVDNSSHTITISTSASQTIDGGASATLKVQYVSLALVSDGSNWNIV